MSEYTAPLADKATIAAAEQASRRWRDPEAGDIRTGSARHLGMLSRVLLETFNPYRPAVIPWPRLDEQARARLVWLPIWNIAVQTEGRARLHILSYARTVQDDALRDALELMGFEEGRHKEVLSHLVAAYGIALEPEPKYVAPRDPEWAFMVTGYSECIDSFFAFGLFELARRSGYFPHELVETFEPVIQEEARHILFFVNWIAWHRATMKPWRRPWFLLKTLGVWSFLLRERIGLARDMGGGAGDANFTVAGSASLAAGELDLAELLAICVSENDRRLSGYDPRLLRPTTMPHLARLALRLLRWLSRRKR